MFADFLDTWLPKNNIKLLKFESFEVGFDAGFIRVFKSRERFWQFYFNLSIWGETLSLSLFATNVGKCLKCYFITDLQEQKSVSQFL